MAEFDWVDLNDPASRIFLLDAANQLHEDMKQARGCWEKCEEQAHYIKELEKQVRLLQKTLNVVNTNKVLERKVKKRGRCQMDKTKCRYV